MLPIKGNRKQFIDDINKAKKDIKDNRDKDKELATNYPDPSEEQEDRGFIDEQ